MGEQEGHRDFELQVSGRVSALEADYRHILAGQARLEAALSLAVTDIGSKVSGIGSAFTASCATHRGDCVELTGKRIASLEEQVKTLKKIVYALGFVLLFIVGAEHREKLQQLILLLL
jgi:hypothetical protein